MLQRRDALLQVAQFGFGQLAHLRIGEQRLGVVLGAFGGAQVADARHHRLDVGQLLRRLDIGLAGQALRQHVAQLVGARGDAVELRRKVHAQARGDLRQRHRLLLAGRQVLHLRHAARDVVVADDHRGACADPVGALHPPPQIAAIRHLGTDAGVAQRLQDVERRRLRAVADRHHGDGRRRGRRVAQQHGQTVDAGGPADCGRGRAAHLVDQPVIATAAAITVPCAPSLVVMNSKAVWP